ncbi:MAG TPA: hypothetical protein H9748_00990, partial [Candidatus Mediterraneibacter norwichensis]|nr:hypothetical protein [Candidatus Mediterraneibacter norwichensis]
GSGGAYKSASILGTAIPELSKKRQIGTWRGHIYLFNAVCGNSRRNPVLLSVGRSGEFFRSDRLPVRQE